MPRVSKYVKDGLTTKQRKFAKGLARGKGKTQAIRDAGYGTRWPGQEAQKQLQKPQVLAAVKKEKERLQKVMNAEIDNKRITHKLSDLMESERDGQPDNASQLKAVDMILKVTGGYAPEKSVNVNVDGESFLEKLAREAREE